MSYRVIDLDIESIERPGALDIENLERPGTLRWIGPPSENPALRSDAQQIGELCGEQRAAAIGQPIPIVFARRVGDRGGVMIAPAATDTRFEDAGGVTKYSSYTYLADGTTETTEVWSPRMNVSYHMVLSDGPMGSVQVRDVYQCGCRVGEFTQTYNRRAGDWRPGNLLTESAILAQFAFSKPPYPPIYCGSVGTCKGISTFSWSRVFLSADKDWRRQVIIFIREGRTVTRLADDVEGPSSNFADLYKVALEGLTKVPADMIDTARLQTAALFLDAQELYCDINIAESQSLSDFAGKNAPYFLLRETKVDGKRGLRPLLPIDDSYAIRTDAIPWEFEFNEDFITPGSIEITHTPLEERKPKLLVALWRQQDDQSFGVIRSAEVGYQADRDSGVVEQHDMSAFCTHELHAVRAMAYKKAFRKWSTHTIAWSCRPEVYNRILEEGDIVRVTFQRNASDGSSTTHDYLYTIEQIEKSVTGEVLFVGSHFPIDAEGRSLIALTVMGAETQGEAYEVIQTGQVCDDGPYGGGGTSRVDDTSVPAEVGQEIETGEPPGPPSLPPVEVEEGDPPILPPASDEQPPPAPQPVLPPVPSPPGDDEPPPEPPSGGYVPPSPAPDPQPEEADDPVDPCEPICTSSSICGEVGEAAPTCPFGSTTVGTITAHYPDGDQTCVICQTCVAPEGCPPLPPASGAGVWKLESTSVQQGSTLAVGRLIEIPEPSTLSKRIVQVNTAVDVSNVITWSPDTDTDTDFSVANRSVAKKDISYWDAENCPRSASTLSGTIYVRTYDSDGNYTGSQTRVSSRGSLAVNCDYDTATESNTLTYIGPGQIRDWWSVSALPGSISGGILITSLPIPDPDLTGPS